MMEPGGGMEDKDALLMAPEDTEPKVEKGLLALLRTDRPGLYVRDPQNQWLLADANLGPNDLILLTGLTLYQVRSSTHPTGTSLPALAEARGSLLEHNAPHKALVAQAFQRWTPGYPLSVDMASLGSESGDEQQKHTPVPLACA